MRPGGAERGVSWERLQGLEEEGSQSRQARELWPAEPLRLWGRERGRVTEGDGASIAEIASIYHKNAHKPNFQSGSANKEHVYTTLGSHDGHMD